MRRIVNNDRGSVGYAHAVVITGMIAIICVLVLDKHTEEVRGRTNAVVEKTYGIEILDETTVSEEPGDTTSVKAKLDGDVLTCDVLTETVGFTVTCDSPDGRITLKEK